MKKIQIISFLLLLVIMFSVITVGYAALADNLTVTGRVEMQPQQFFGVYISDAQILSVNGIALNKCEYVLPTNLKTDFKVNQREATVTLAITVHNNTDITYWYLGIDKSSDYENNSLISATNGIFITTKDREEDSTNTFNDNDWVPPQTYRTFYVTYRFGSNTVGTSIKNLINFRFGLRMDAVQDEFVKILNDSISQNGYNFLADEFDKKYAEDKTTVIGNIGDDEAIFDRMFGGDLAIDIDGVKTPVTVMISRKNVDGNSGSGDSYGVSGGPAGCEYTLFVTADSLDGKTATVYAVSYTYKNGVWYQIGELYEGTCSTKKYDSEGNMAFDITTWDATPKIYQVTNDISYKVGYEQGTNFDKLDSIEELFSTNDQEFYNAVNNNSAKLLKPVCNILYSYVHNNGQWIESTNTANAFNPGYDELLDAFAKIKPYCYIGNGAQEVKLQNVNSLTRAELIPLLEAVQRAYDYYCAVNGI